MGSKEDSLRELYREYAATPMLQGVAHNADGSPKRLVMPAGPLGAPVMVVGEAPGSDEVKSGEPFTGPAGQHLQKLFAEAKVPWEYCYRTNTIPWRPSEGNRTPYPFEIDSSSYRVRAEIALICPQVVIAAGAVAWQAVTDKQHGIFGSARGKWLQFRLPDGLPCDLLAIYHPAALLRAPGNRSEEMTAETMTALDSILEGERVAA